MTKNGILLSAHIIISCMVLLPLFFHGKVFGKLRYPDVSLSLFGQPHGIGFSRVITCGLEALILLTGALCVVAVVRQWIICCYIVERLIGCGALSINLWDLMGPLWYNVRSSFWLVELVREAFISHLEFSFIVFDVVYLEGTQSADV